MTYNCGASKLVSRNYLSKEQSYLLMLRTELKHFPRSPFEGLLNDLFRKVGLKNTEHTLHKAKCFNFQLVQFEISRTLLKNDIKVKKKHYDVIIKYCRVQIFSAKIIFLLKSKQITKFHNTTVK